MSKNEKRPAPEAFDGKGAQATETENERSNAQSHDIMITVQ